MENGNANAISDEQRAELEARYPRLCVLESDQGDAAFRVPTPQEWQRFIDELNTTGAEGVALKHLVHACRVWPEKPVFDRMLLLAPGLAQSFGNELAAHVGAFKAAVRKK